MKKIMFVFISFFLFFSGAGLYSQETSAVWSRLYSRALSFEHKYEIMTSLVELHDREMVPVLSSALEEIISGNRNIAGGTDRIIINDLTRIIVKELGNLRAQETADLVFTVFLEGWDPVVRGEAVIALGKMGARQYAGSLAMFLRNLNFNAGSQEQRREGEILAFACVNALEMLGDPVGFEPVFFASLGWYSGASRVKETAKQALNTMVEDPSKELIIIIKANPEFTVKLAAVEAAALSQAPPKSREQVAREALNQGLMYQSKDIREQNALRQIRTGAAGIIKSSTLTIPEIIPLMERVLYGDFDINEKLSILEALGTSSMEDAVKAAVRFLKYQNERQSTGITSDDNRLIISTIRTLGILGNPLAREELLMVKHSNWTGAVAREAAAVLEKL